MSPSAAPPTPDALAHKRALVTGGGRGIGRAIACQLANAGAHVVVCGRAEEPLAQTAAAIRTQGGSADYRTCDVTDEGQIHVLFDQIDADGGLDVLINNAGIGIFKPVADMSLAEWQRVLDTNMGGAFLCAREAMQRMHTRGGRIINIGSVVSLKGYPNQGAYTASKHGLLGLTKVLAIEGQPHGILVQAVCPGGVDTGLVGDARPDLDRDILMRPEEIAAAVLYLLSQTGNAITDVLSLRRRTSAPFAV